MADQKASDLYSFPMNSYDRARLAFANAARLDLDGTVRAIFQPTTLSPQQRKSFSQEYAGDPLMQAVVDTATNPLVIIGVLLHLRFPLLKAHEIFKMRHRASQSSGLSWLGRNISNLMSILDDRPDLWKIISGASKRSRGWVLNNYEPIQKAFQTAFTSKLGRGPTEEELHIISHMVKGHMEPMSAKGNRLFNNILGTTGVNLTGKSILNAEAIRKMPSYGAMRHVANVAGDQFNKMWDTLGSEEAQAVLKDVLKNHYIYDPVIGLGRSVKRGKIQLGRKQSNYLPEIINLNPNSLSMETPDITQYLKEVAARTGGKQSVSSPVAKNLLTRGVNLPDMEELGRLADKGLVDPEVYKAMKDFKVTYSGQLAPKMKEIFAHSPLSTLQRDLTKMFVEDYQLSEGVAEGLTSRAAYLAKTEGRGIALQELFERTKLVGEVPEYRTRFDDVYARYVHASAPTVGWTLPPEGSQASYFKQLGTGMQTLDPLRKQIISETYLPVLTGRKTAHQIRTQAIYRDTRLRYYEVLQTDKVKRLMSHIPGGEKARQYLSESLSQANTPIDPYALNSRLASWLYYGALGFNPSPAAKNLLQPVITTLNVVGPQSMSEGLSTLLPKLRKMRSIYKQKLASGLAADIADEEAKMEVFPRFMAEDLSMPMLQDLTEGSINKLSTGARSIIQKGKQASMKMFSATETLNRLWTWEAGLAHARRTSPGIFTDLKTGTLKDEAYEFASKLVHQTQFPGGILGIPSGLANVPPPLRQFMQFPLRMVDYLKSSLRYGSGVPGKPGVNLGTIGRTMAASGVTYEAAKHLLKTDLSGALLFGALPAPSWEGAPFYPFPLVPPAVSMAGSAAQAVLSGDYSHLGQGLAVGMPGGLAAYRAAKYLSPYKADYSQYSKTGLIPVYDSQGKLIQNFTPIQLFARSIGIRTTDQTTQNQLAEYLLKQRDTIREIRRQFLEALSHNDVEKARKIQEDFRHRYPELGPLRVKKTDLKAVSNRHQMDRVQRILSGLPAAYQPLMKEVVGMSQAEQTVGMMENGGSLGLFLGPR